MWFGQTGLNANRFETGLSASVNGAYDKAHTKKLKQKQSTYNASLVPRLFGGGGKEPGYEATTMQATQPNKIPINDIEASTTGGTRWTRELRTGWNG